MKNRYIALLMIAGLVACNKVDPSNYTDWRTIAYEKAWAESIGPVDENQTWNSAVRSKLNISADEPSTVYIYTLGLEERSLLAVQEVKSSCTVEFDAPMGLDAVAVYRRNSAGEDEYKSVKMAEIRGGNASVSLQSNSTKAGMSPMAAMSDENKAKLTMSTLTNPSTGKTAKIWGYTSFPGWIWADINKAMPENTTVKGQVTNFEMQSNGLFYIALIYGVTGNTSANIGYYYYDKSSPSDITFVPLVDALQADYYYDGQTVPTAADALPKTLWKSKDTGLWQPTNYFYYDMISNIPSGINKSPERKGDDQYNTMAILNAYGNDDESLNKIDAVKGLTFQVDVPEGNMVGFYADRGSFKNHTTASMNQKGWYDAVIKSYDGFRFVGLEDSEKVSEDRRDCNDLVLVMVAGNDGTLPGLILPNVYDIDKGMYYNPEEGTWSETPQKETSDLQSWTLAFEDMSTVGDFDFNDVVIRVTPDERTESATVKVCATGGSISSWLYYKGQNLGEVHQLLGSAGSDGSNIIANTYSVTYPYKTLPSVSWPAGNSMSTNAKDFYIRTSNRTVTLPETGQVPNAICVSGNWAWPKECVNISDAYPDFGAWGSNYSNPEYQGWYAKSAEGKTVRAQ